MTCSAHRDASLAKNGRRSVGVAAAAGCHDGSGDEQYDEQPISHASFLNDATKIVFFGEVRQILRKNNAKGAREAKGDGAVADKWATA